jgi:hypothetical protein
MKGISRKNVFLLTMKSLLNPSLPKSGIFGNDIAQNNQNK